MVARGDLERIGAAFRLERREHQRAIEIDVGHESPEAVNDPDEACRFVLCVGRRSRRTPIPTKATANDTSASTAVIRLFFIVSRPSGPPTWSADR